MEMGSTALRSGRTKQVFQSLEHRHRCLRTRPEARPGLMRCPRCLKASRLARTPSHSQIERKQQGGWDRKGPYVYPADLGGKDGRNPLPGEQRECLERDHELRHQDEEARNPRVVDLTQA